METNDINWDEVGRVYDHWSEGNSAVRAELLRVAQMSFTAGTANADWVKEFLLEDLSLETFNEASFAAVLHAKLQEQVSSMKAKSLRNPFIAQPYTSDLGELAHRFARAYLTTTPPDNVLSALQVLDKLDEQVQYLTDAVCQQLVKEHLVSISKLGYSSWAGISKDKLYSDSTQDDKVKHSFDDAKSNLSTITKPGKKKRASLKPTRSEILQKVHGFPWRSSIKPRTLNLLQAYFTEEELIDPFLTEEEFATIFSIDGPGKPIRILNEPGKLVIIFRWLSEEVLILPKDFKDIDLNDSGSLKKLGYWLNPRLAGTFIYKTGENFTTRQLTKAANHLMKDVKSESAWYHKMSMRLKEAANFSKLE